MFRASGSQERALFQAPHHNLVFGAEVLNVFLANVPGLQQSITLNIKYFINYFQSSHFRETSL